MNLSMVFLNSDGSIECTNNKLGVLNGVLVSGWFVVTGETITYEVDVLMHIYYVNNNARNNCVIQNSEWKIFSF